MTGVRPALVVLVVGTGTDIGKTFVAARLLEAWRRSGRTVAARKPAQSFTPDTGPTDADVLAAASGEDPTAVCLPHRCYPVALAPPMAAAALGRPGPTMADFMGELAWPAGDVDVGLVETAGGVRSPQADDGDVLDLMSVLLPDRVVLVADAGLGTVNVVRLTMAALAGGQPAPGVTARRPLVVLNRFDESCDLHRRNRAWFEEVDGYTAWTVTDGAVSTSDPVVSLAEAALAP